MKWIDNEGVTDPRINLEEYCLRRLPPEEDYLLFYINEPSVIIGKNQNTAEEINESYIKEKGIHVVRRLSGGGAVYHDLGNLNFSFITKDDGQSFQNFRKFTEPVVSALREMGVQAELTGRNDIEVDGKKISGNAQYASKGRMFSHGTLLFASEMEHVADALKVSADKIKSKGIASVRSRVANISDYLPEPVGIDEFKDKLLQSIFEGAGEIPVYRLSPEEWQEVRSLSAERYAAWDWNYGKSPAADYQTGNRFEGIGRVDVRLSLNKGKIVSCRIYGDFFGRKDIRELETLLEGIPFGKDAIEEALRQTDVGDYIGKLSAEEFLSLFD